jgi:hypothetical protein
MIGQRHAGHEGHCFVTIFQMNANASIWNHFFGLARVGQEMLAGSGRLKVYGGLLAATIGFDLVAEPLVLVERGHAGAFDGADMDKAVAAAVFRRNEAIALVGVEEFDGADWHECFLSRNGKYACKCTGEACSVEGKVRPAGVKFRRMRR